MLKRILVALTGSPCGAATTQYAVELARMHDARLTGVTLANPRKLKNVGSVPIGAGAAARELREHRIGEAHRQMERALDEFQATCRAAGVTARVGKEEGDPYSLLLDISRYHDLVVFSARGGHTFGHASESRGLLGPLVTHGVRPLLAVAETYRPIRRALIAYSGSRESAKTMRRFAQINAWPDVETEVAVFDHPPEKAQALLDAAIEYCRDHGFEAQGRCLPGSARDGLLPHAAECDADLIVMGYSTRTRFSKILVGETGLRVLRDTDRAVFLSQ